MSVARTLKRTLAIGSLAGRCGGGAGHGRNLLQKGEPRFGFGIALTLALGGRYSKKQLF